MWRQIWISIRLFGWLFERIPMIEWRFMAPSAAVLAVLPLLSWKFADDPDTAFRIGFWLFMVLRFSMNLHRTMAMIKDVVLGAFVAGFLVGLGMIAWHAGPIWCQRILSGLFLGWALLLAVDLIDKSHFVAHKYWPEPELVPYHRAMTAMMALSYLTLLALNETMIRVLAPMDWLVFAALLPLIDHVLKFAALRTAYWMPDARE